VRWTGTLKAGEGEVENGAPISATVLERQKRERAEVVSDNNGDNGPNNNENDEVVGIRGLRCTRHRSSPL